MGLKQWVSECRLAVEAAFGSLREFIPFLVALCVPIRIVFGQRGVVSVFGFPVYMYLESRASEPQLWGFRSHESSEVGGKRKDIQADHLQLEVDI